MEVRKGQKIILHDKKYTCVFQMNASSKVVPDISAFLVGDNGKVAGDDDFIFYGNTFHKSGAVAYRDSENSIVADINLIPSYVEKIAITATIYDVGKNFSQVHGASFKLIDSAGKEFANFKPDNFTVETAIVIGEFYRYKESWKFNAIGAGFSGGLKSLCENFGIEVIEENPAPVQEILPPVPAQPPKQKKSRQSKKIELRKGQKINLVKKYSALGEIVVNLNWNESSITHGTDLDLCCLFELKDGYVGAIQSLGNLFGNFHEEPYISLDGDDRLGNFHTAETLRINGKFFNSIQGILIYVSVYSGRVNWETLGGLVTIKCANNPEIVVKINEYGSNKKTCAVVLLENIGGTFSVEKVLSFFYDSQEMDEAFDWGLDWTSGEK